MKRYVIFSLVIVCLAMIPAGHCFAKASDTTAVEKNGGAMIVNLNKASKDELIQVAGLGPTLADRIIAYRDNNGPFANLQDVMLVKGIGEAKFKKIEAMITV